MQIVYIRKYLRSHLFYCYVKIPADPEVQYRRFMRTTHMMYINVQEGEEEEEEEDEEEEEEEKEREGSCCIL